MTVQSKFLGPIIVVVFIVGIGLSMAFNLWTTESTKTPVAFSSGEFAGEFNPGDIRGSYSFDDIAGSFEVSVDVLARAFAVTDDENPAAFQAKELEEIYGETADGGEVGTDAVRLFVARYTGLPYTPEENTRLPAPAVALLKEKLSTVDFEAMRAIQVSVLELKNSGGDASATSESASEEHVSTEDRTVKGNTTFDDLLSWGLTKDEIEIILKLPMGQRSMTVRDYLVKKELEFSTYKVEFQTLVDSKVDSE